MEQAELASPRLDVSSQVWLLTAFGFAHPPFYLGGGALPT